MNLSRTFSKLENDKQQRILDTAIEEFARHGFRQASVNRMVQSLGIAKGSIFQYFGNKEGLFQVIFNYAVEMVRRSLRQVKQETADSDFFERIRKSLLAGIFFIERSPANLPDLSQDDLPGRFSSTHGLSATVHCFGRIPETHG